MLHKRFRATIKLLHPSTYLSLFLCVPLFFLPGLPATTGRTQALLSMIILIAGIVMSLQIKPYKTAPLWLKVIIALIFTAIISTIAGRLIGHKPLYFLGLDPDYMGLFAWIGIVCAGIFWAPNYKTLLDSRSIWFVLVIACWLAGIPSLASNTPLMGIFPSASMAALVANILVLSSVSADKKIWWPGFLLGAATVLVTQDTLGLFCLFALLVVNLYWHRQSKTKFWILGILLISVALPALLPGRFWSLRQASVTTSVRETSSLYGQTHKNFKPSLLLYGIGPATLTTDTNNQNPVPASIVRDAVLPGIAFGRHGLLYDSFIFFGGLALLAVVTTMVMATYYWLSGKVVARYFILYGLLLVYSLLFPPTIFVTSLFFIVQFGLLINAPKRTTHAKQSLYRLAILVIMIAVAGLLYIIPKRLGAQQSVTATSPTLVQQFDESTQSILENSVKKQLNYSSSPRGSAVLLDANTGTIEVMVDVISVAPNACKNTLSCKNPQQNANLQAWEPGSVMKPLLVAAALDANVTNLNDTFQDPPYRKIDDFAVYDAQSHPPESIRIQDVLNKSRNTGAIHVFEQFKKTGQPSNVWLGYLKQNYLFGTPTGVDASEDAGTIPSNSRNRNLQRQVTMSSYGIGITVTPVQLAAAYASLVNGGIYNQPHLKNDTSYSSFRALSSETSSKMFASLTEVYAKNKVVDLKPGLVLGGKTGTAPTYDAGQSYKPTVDIGVYAGFIQTNGKTRILVVKVNEPKTKEFASYAARDAWTNIVQELY